jgi:hypothetical protein
MLKVKLITSKYTDLNHFLYKVKGKQWLSLEITEGCSGEAGNF